MRVVISQSMYFPWVGLLEQIRLADVFVHYDDVQLSRGFYNRVQVKTRSGTRWLTIPLQNHHRGQRIDEVTINGDEWQRSHRDILRQCYALAPFLHDMLSLVDLLIEQPSASLAAVSRTSIFALADYFNLRAGRCFIDSQELGIGGSSTQRLLDITRAVGGTTYITGHGARNYLDHELFERAGVTVEYMSYRCVPYPQLHGPFTPYVTALDLVANCGPCGAAFICSGTIPWRKFLHECTR
jgi:hypothetical protein